MAVRQGPEESATKFAVGTRKRGNDGEMWEVTQTSAGVRRWKRDAAKRDVPKPKGKVYYTHDNGGRPFQITIDGKTVHVHAYSNQKEMRKSNYTIDREYKKHIGTFKTKKVFIGKSPRTFMTDFSGGHGPKFTGNSFLLHLVDSSSSLKYLYIGSNIYSFIAPEEIVKYYSPVGNSDIPYPVARSKSYAFFMLDDAKYTEISNFKTVRASGGETAAWVDLYGEFYNQNKEYDTVNPGAPERPEKCRGRNDFCLPLKTVKQRKIVAKRL